MNVSALPRFPEPPPAIRIQADATPVPPGRLIGLVWFRIRRRLSALSLLVRSIPEFLVGWRRWHFWRLAAQAVVVTLLVFTPWLCSQAPFLLCAMRPIGNAPRTIYAKTGSTSIAGTGSPTNAKPSNPSDHRLKRIGYCGLAFLGVGFSMSGHCLDSLRAVFR